MWIFPVRHHSPAAALQVQRLIRELRPQAVLVEGPSDATPLIPLLLDPATKPPVAVYAYRMGEGKALYYPFCDYSPEYVALKEGQAVGARLAFCDLPAAVTLLRKAEPLTDGKPPAEEEAASADEGVVDAPRYGDFTAALADAAGFASFESLWEAAFEQDAGRDTPARYVEVLADFGAKARLLTAEPADDLRERQMAAAALALLGEGIPDEKILLVCGAAHAEPIERALKAGVAPPPLPEAPPAELALIPYSFPRLSEQSGYGAGNRAPWYYQQIWALQGDYQTATRLALTTLAQQLRARGYAASLAQAIDAYSLAMTLAAMRAKVAPGVDELLDAAVACFGQGRAEGVQTALHQVLVGDAVGAVTTKMGRTPLQAEFYAAAQALGLPIIDAPRQVLLHIGTVPKEAEQSVFLHRLALAAIPYGQQLEGGIGGGRAAANQDPLTQLSRVREKWQLQWSPATDAALIEQTAHGSTFQEVGRRLLEQQLQRAQQIDAGTGVLLQMALCELTESFPQALERCEALAADESSFPSLARATYHLDGLLAYGSARRLPVDALAEMARRLFLRAALHLPAAALGGDDAADEITESLKSLYDLVSRKSPAAAEQEPFWEALQTVAGLEGSHPTVRGISLILLELGGHLAPGELAGRLRFWLSATTEAADNARLVAGLFALHRSTLVRNKSLIRAVTDFLQELEIEQLTPLLPTLRRTLGNLSPAERAYLSETLATLLGVQTRQASQALKLTDPERELLREADAAVAQILTNWRERYGIQ